MKNTTATAYCKQICKHDNNHFIITVVSLYIYITIAFNAYITYLWEYC